LIRTCEGLVDVFLVLYAIDVVGISAPAYGVLIAVQAATAIVSYLPVARLADRIGRKPFVIATFIAFAAFPVAVVLAHDFTTLIGAFIVVACARSVSRRASDDRRSRATVAACSLHRPVLPHPEPHDRAGGVHRRCPLEPHAGASLLDGRRDRSRRGAVFAATVEERYAS